MLRLRRRPELLGNIGLLLFVAFLVAYWWATPVQAAAPGQDGRQDVRVVNAERLSDGRIMVKFDLTPLTPTPSLDPTTVQLLLKVGDGSYVQVKGTVYKVYGEVPSAVYGIVYLVYNVPQDVAIRPDLVSVQVYVYQNVLKAVYVAVAVEPPKPGPGAPPPSTPSGPEGEAPAGRIVEEQGTATYEVDPGKIADAVAQAGDTVILEVPATVQADNVAFEIPRQALDTVASAGKSVALVAANLNLRVEVDAQSLSELRQAVGGAALVFTASRVPDAEAPSRPSSTAGFRPAGDVIEVELAALEGSSKRPLTLSRPVKLAVPYKPANLGGLPDWKVGVYRYDEGTGAWQFVGGKVDAQAKQVIAFRTGFSLYTAMAYDKTFTDIAGHWARMDIERMASQHIARGVDASRFLPEGPVTRAEFAALVARALQLQPLRPARATFSDVGPQHWAFGEVEAAVAAGLVSGVAPGRFDPGARITREQMAAILMRALRRVATVPEVPPADAERLLAPFADAGTLAPWARQAVAEAVHAGLIQGRAATRLAPKDQATRAEAVVLIKRLLIAAGRL